MVRDRDAAARLPVVLHSALPLLASYDVVISDIWGVLHDGVTAYPAAGAVLTAFRNGGGTVILVSNAPAPADVVARSLARRGVPRSAYDAIVSSGELTRATLRERGWRRIYHIGPPEDLPLFRPLPHEFVGLQAAEAVVVTGLIDEVNETAETYRGVLRDAHGLGLTLVCANPDLIVEQGPVLLPCAGVVAELYESLGGPVIWAGKPHAIAYEAAMSEARRVTGRSEIERGRVLAIGDSVRTDLAGAQRFNVDSLMIAAGIHRKDLLGPNGLDLVALARLLAPPAPRPVAVMPFLA